MLESKKLKYSAYQGEDTMKKKNSFEIYEETDLTGQTRNRSAQKN